MIDFITKVRYLQPLEGIWEAKFIATIFAVIGSLIEYFTDFFSNLFMTDFELIFLLILAIFIDMVVGIYASKKRKNPISSIGLRQTIVKIIEYSLIIILFIGMSNAYGKYIDEEGIASWLAPFAMNIDVFAFFFLYCVEIKSIAENLADDNNTIKQLIIEIKKRLNRHASND